MEGGREWENHRTAKNEKWQGRAMGNVGIDLSKKLGEELGVTRNGELGGKRIRNKRKIQNNLFGVLLCRQTCYYSRLAFINF